MASRLVVSTLAGISESSLRRVLGAHHLLQARVDMARLDGTESMVSPPRLPRLYAKSLQQRLAENSVVDFRGR